MMMLRYVVFLHCYMNFFICRFVFEMHYEIFFIDGGNIQMYWLVFLEKFEGLSRTGMFQNKCRECRHL